MLKVASYFAPQVQSHVTFSHQGNELLLKYSADFRSYMLFKRVDYSNPRMLQIKCCNFFYFMLFHQVWIFQGFSLGKKSILFPPDVFSRDVVFLSISNLDMT